ncbi:MAG: serine/threonine protein kinase [Chloroflexota bacterium]|nr:serine/threonine protein kinase [Chloroflexota bacterium]
MNATPQRLEKYELYKLLGHGSTGEVWKGIDLQSRQEVAIKLLHPDLLQNDPNFITLFMKEWQSIADLHHPNIVQVHEATISRPSKSNNETTPYIVMDYIEGQTTLAKSIQRTSHIGMFPPVSEIVTLFTRIGAAIDYAHEQHIVHNNIKPENILLDVKNTSHLPGGEPLLTDFGSANLPGNKNNASPLYISPEQAKGGESEKANPRSDIYALGVILYEICTGVQPFHGESNVVIMKHHINTLPTSPMLINPNIPLSLSEVILRAMAKDPKSRYATASLLAEAIAEACSIEQLPQTALNKKQDQDATEEPFFYTNSGPWRVPTVPTTKPQLAPNGMISILGVSQPFSSTSARHVAMPGQENIVRREVGGNTRPTPIPPQANLITPSTFGGSTTVYRSALTQPQTQTSGRLVTPIIPTPSMKLPATSIVSSAIPGVRESDLKLRSKNFLSPVALAIIGLLLLLVVVSALGASLLFHSAPDPSANGVVGHVFFQDDAFGKNDMLRIEMPNIPDPPQGKQYVAWLQSASGQVMPLGQLAVQNGSATLLYPGNAQHSNLLSLIRGVFVTQENNGASIPAFPSLNTKVYQAGLPTASFQYIQHILYALPGYPAHSSLIAGLFDSIKGIDDKAVSVVDSIQVKQGYPLAQRQATRIIELIDGSQFARGSGDLPASFPAMLSLPVGLLSSPTQAGYIDTLAVQVNKILMSAGDTSALHQHAQNVSNALVDLKGWLQQMRSYDVQLLKATNLGDPAVLNAALQLRQLAGDAYTGRTIPPNEGPTSALNSAGANQAYIECQYLAALDIERV